MHDVQNKFPGGSTRTRTRQGAARLPQPHWPQPGMAPEQVLHTRPFSIFPSPYCLAGHESMHDPLSNARYLLSSHIVHMDPLLHAWQLAMAEHTLHARPTTPVPSPYCPAVQDAVHDPLSSERYLLSPHVVHTDPLLHAVQLGAHALHTRPTTPVPSPYCPAGQDVTHHPVPERYLLSPHVSHRSALLHAVQLPVPAAPLHDLHTPLRPSASTPFPYDPEGQDDMQEPLSRERNLLFSHIVQRGLVVHALQSALHATQKPPFAECAPYCPAVGQLSKQDFLSILRNLAFPHWVHSNVSSNVALYGTVQAMQSEHGLLAEHAVHFLHSRPYNSPSAGLELSSPRCEPGHSSTHVVDQPTGN